MPGRPAPPLPRQRRLQLGAQRRRQHLAALHDQHGHLVTDQPDVDAGGGECGQRRAVADAHHDQEALLHLDGGLVDLTATKAARSAQRRLASPEATAASWSPRARSSRSDTAISRPSEVTTIAWAMPGTRRTKLDTSQLTFCASLLSCAIAVLEKVRAYGTGHRRLQVRNATAKARNSQGRRSEEARRARFDATQRVVVELHAADATRAGQDPRLGRERQRREHAPDALQSDPQPLQVAGELLDPIDLAAPLDLHRDVGATLVPAQQVDRADVGAVLAADQAPAVAERLAPLGQQLLEVALDAVLDQSPVDAEVVAGIVQDFLQGDGHG